MYEVSIILSVLSYKESCGSLGLNQKQQKTLNENEMKFVISFLLLFKSDYFKNLKK